MKIQWRRKLTTPMIVMCVVYIINKVCSLFFYHWGICFCFENFGTFWKHSGKFCSIVSKSYGNDQRKECNDCSICVIHIFLYWVTGSSNITSIFTINNSNTCIFLPSTSKWSRAFFKVENEDNNNKCSIDYNIEN